MSVNVNDISITSLETIVAMDIKTGAWKFTLDELQSATIANSQDTTDITGKGGRKLNTIKKNKAVTVSGTNGLLSGGLLATQVGSQFTSSSTAKVLVPDYLTITGNKATTTYAATGTTGAEIESIYIRNSDGTNGTVLTQGTTAAAGVFTYTPGTKTLTFLDGAYADGTEIAAYYFRTTTGSVLENVSDQYSEKVALYIDAFGEDTCNNIYRVQFYIPVADFSGTFDLAMGDNQTTHAFEATSLTSNCGGNGSLWTYTIFSEEE